jgi:hypothetical protein
MISRMFRPSRCVAFGAMTLASAAACEAFDSDPTSVGQDAAVAVDGGDPAGTVLFERFTDAQSNCQGWTASNADLSGGVGRGGAGCSVCRSSAGSFGLYTATSKSVGAGAYYLEAWFRRSTTSTDITAADVHLELVTETDSFVTPGGTRTDAETWKRSQLNVTLTEPRQVSVKVTMINGGLGECVVVDDVWMVRQ